METDSELSVATQRVLDTAERLFMEKGFAPVTLRDIADELGIRQASLYYHFPEGKEQLYVMVVERVFARHRAGMEAAIGTAGLSLCARLQAVADWFGTQPAMNFLGMMHADLPALGAPNAARVAQIAYQAMFGPLQAILVDAQDRGEARSFDPRVIAGFFIALLDGITFSLTQQQNVPRSVLAREAVQLMLVGITADEHSSGEGLA